jgi:acetylornithine deacetylase/succinyl-diaminopimelate desuccinylase-like protein
MDEALLRRVLDTLCRVRSASGEEEAMAEVLVTLGRALGFGATAVAVDPGRPNVILEWGSTGDTILFSAHLDTQRPPGAEVSPPRWRAGRYFGEGVNNMKAALAAMISAMSALRDSATRGHVVILAAMGEIDTLGRGTTSALRDGLTATGCINGEPTNLGVLLRHAGVARFRIEVHGRATHVTQRAGGVNAIPPLAKVVAQLDDGVISGPRSPRFPGLPLLNVGRIEGGTGAAMLAGLASAEVDVRWVPPMTRETVRQDLIRFAENAAGPRARVTVESLGPPGFYSPAPFDADRRWPPVEAVVDAHEAVVGRPPRIGSWRPVSTYGSDAPHIVEAGIPTCIYGPGRTLDINRHNEGIVWADVVTAARVYERAVSRLLSTPS